MKRRLSVFRATGFSKLRDWLLLAAIPLALGAGCSQHPGTPAGSTASNVKQGNVPEPEATKQAIRQKKNDENVNSKKPSKIIAEDLAREKLKVALDSWAFGDSKEKLEKDHPELKFASQLRVTSKLTKYEITSTRSFELGHQFLVSLSVKSMIRNEPPEEQRLYEVFYDKENKISILELNPSYLK